MINSITTFELESLLNAENINLIDVRSNEEFEAGHVKTAINIPLNHILLKSKDFNINETYYIICRTGNKSSIACQLLNYSQDINVVDVLGGMFNWQGEIVVD